VITKPFQREELINTINQVLNNPDSNTETRIESL